MKEIGVKYSVNPLQPFEKYIEAPSKASLFGLLSEKESYPQSINEANAIGVPIVVAEPWGRNFSGRARTIIVDLRQSDEALAEKIANFLKECGSQSKSHVPSWDQIVDTYIKNIYG